MMIDLGIDRHRHRARHQPPEILDDADAADQHAERRDHGEGQVPIVDAPEHDPFHRQGGEAADDHAAQHAEPDVSDRQADGIGDVGADRIIEQLVEADDAHQAETKRQPDRHQEKDASQAQAEDNAGDQQLRVDHRLLPPRSAALPVTRRNVFLISGSSVPQMPFSPASMMNTSTKPMTSSQLPSTLLSTSFMPV